MDTEVLLSKLTDRNAINAQISNRKNIHVTLIGLKLSNEMNGFRKKSIAGTVF
jgi:hypothetical protein